MKLNENIKVLPEASLSIKQRVAAYLIDAPDATLIRLDQSLMNMPLPPKVTEEMKRAVDEVSAPFGVRLSSPWSGYQSLKERIVEHLLLSGAKVDESEVFITSGLESAHSCIAQLFAGDSTVLLPDPCQRNLLELQQCLGRNVLFSSAKAENGFCPTPDREGECVVYLANPNPVTGAVMNREKMTSWVNFANETGSVIIHDASLSEYIRGEDVPHSIYEIEGARNCAIELFSFENGYGVRELKIAYVVIPSVLEREGTRLRELWCARQPATATPPSFVMQRAAEMLFSSEAREGTEKIIHRIKKVGKTLAAGLARAGIPSVGSETSPFIWAECPKGLSAWQCFDLLLEKARIVVTPGSLFGYGGENFIRLTAFGMPEEAAEAALRMEALFSPAPAPKDSQDASPALPEEEKERTEEETAAMLFSAL